MVKKFLMVLKIYNKRNKNCIKKSNSKNNLIGNKIADKITSVSKKSTKETKVSISRVSLKDVPKTRYISPEERLQVIDELRLVTI